MKTFPDGANYRIEVSGIETPGILEAVIDEAKKCRIEDKKKVIVFNLSGHGLLDLSAYDEFIKGELK